MAHPDRHGSGLLSSAARVLFLFLDGVGIGPAGDDNPLTDAALPTIEALLDGRRPLRDALEPADPGGPAATAPYHAGRASLVGLDATAGVPGTPQSGTGHATLLTGEDAVARFGRHHGPWVPVALRPLVAERSVLARARAAGRAVAFANAYPEELMDRVPEDVPASDAVTSGRLGPLRSGPPLAALGARVLTRHTDALARGDAVASEITNHGWIRRLGRTRLPEIGPAAAGANLAGIAAAHELTLFAHYSLDYVGHRGTRDDATAALERVDAFLAGLLDALPPDTLLLVASDHGNIEDVTREHTLNPALGIVVGPGHRDVADGWTALWDVPRTIIEALGLPPAEAAAD